MNNKFNFLTITKEDFISRKDLLREIKDGEVSGVIVKEFFSKTEVDSLVNHYLSNDLKRSQLPLNQGVTYPTVFAHVQKETGNTEPGISNYFLACEAYRSNFNHQFGVDAPHAIQSAFEATSGGRVVRLPVGVTGKGVYPFSTFRELNPGTGEMTLHCGLYFYYMFPEFYKHLHSIVADNNQLSFFSLLRKPQAGGELTIFDITRKDAVEKIDDLQLKSLTGEVLHIEQNVDNFKLQIEEGDFLIFDGGTIWHRVELVQGNTHRITFGGFLGFTKDNQELYYWS